MAARRATGRRQTAVQRAELGEAELDAAAAEPTAARLQALERQGVRRNRVAWWMRELDGEPGIYAVSGAEETERLISRGFTTVEELEGARLDPLIANHRPSKYKLGMSTSLKDRLGAYRVCWPLGFRVFGIIRFDKRRLQRYYAWKELTPPLWAGEERKMRSALKKIFRSVEHLEQRFFANINDRKWALPRLETGQNEYFDFGEDGHAGLTQAMQTFTEGIQAEWEEQWQEPGNSFAIFQPEIKWITVDDLVAQGDEAADPDEAPNLALVVPPQPAELAQLRRELRSGGQRAQQDALVMQIANGLNSRELNKLLNRHGFRDRE